MTDEIEKGQNLIMVVIWCFHGWSDGFRYQIQIGPYTNDILVICSAILERLI
jgi:hypothetical protein